MPSPRAPRVPRVRVPVVTFGAAERAEGEAVWPILLDGVEVGQIRADMSDFREATSRGHAYRVVSYEVEIRLPGGGEVQEAFSVQGVKRPGWMSTIGRPGTAEAVRDALSRAKAWARDQLARRSVPVPAAKPNGATPAAEPLVLWHGARRWEGPPQIRAGRKGRVERGPGLYLTTAYETARKYAKGGGVVLRVELDPNLNWLEGATVPLDDALALYAKLRLNPAFRRRESEYLADSSKRLGASLPPRSVFATFVVNLLVNGGAVSGPNGPIVAAWLVEHGIHASLIEETNHEDWLVLFDPSKVLRVTPEFAGKTLPAPLPLVRSRVTTARTGR